MIAEQVVTSSNLPPTPARRMLLVFVQNALPYIMERIRFANFFAPVFLFLFFVSYMCSFCALFLSVDGVIIFLSRRMLRYPVQ